MVFPVLIILSGCGKKPANAIKEPLPETRIETLDDLEIHQLYCPSYEKLPLRLKQYAYHLYRACVAGRDIAFDQRIHHGRELKRFVDFLARKEVITSPALTAGWRRYSKLFWACTGNYHQVSRRKFVPDVNPTAFWKEIEAHFISTGSCLEEVYPNVRNALIFDSSVSPALICDSGSSADPIASSAINLYNPSLTYEQVKAHMQRHARNGRLTLQDGQLVEEYYRIRSEEGVPGRMADAISNVVTELQSAIGHAAAPAVPLIDQLVSYLITGDMESFNNHLALLSRDTSDVIFRIGFFDTSKDPLGKRGIFGGMVLVKNHETTAQLRAVLDDHPDRENHFAYDVLCATGCYGPLCPVWIKGEEGIMGQPVLLSNILETLASAGDSLDLQKATASLEDIQGTRSRSVQNRYVFIMPQLEPVWNRMGTIIGFNLVYTRDFARQMVEFSR